MTEQLKTDLFKNCTYVKILSQEYTWLLIYLACYIYINLIITENESDCSSAMVNVMCRSCTPPPTQARVLNTCMRSL